MTEALKLDNLSKTFPVGKPLFGPPKFTVKAVRPVTLTVQTGETLGIVGESGCGKSTLARMLVGLIPPTTGTIRDRGQGARQCRPGGFRQVDPVRVSGSDQQPQPPQDDPPDHRGAAQTPARHEQGRPRQAHLRDLRHREPARRFPDRYPHEFSGGQAQRIGIARALAANARILILDEPVSALDVSVQAQVLNLLAKLKREFGLTYLFISHDLAVVEAVSTRVAVLYFGAVVEIGKAEDIFNRPRHPYTKLLADSAPVVGRPLKAPEGRETELPDPLNPPPGCSFAARCPRATDLCRQTEPQLTEMGEHQLAACHHPLDA